LTLRCGPLRSALLARRACMLWCRLTARVRRSRMLLRSCVLTAWNRRRCSVRRVLAERRTRLGVLMERRARLRARYVVALRGCRVRRPCGELLGVALRVVRCAALRRGRIRGPCGELPRVVLRVARC